MGQCARKWVVVVHTENGECLGDGDLLESGRCNRFGRCLIVRSKKCAGLRKSSKKQTEFMLSFGCVPHCLRGEHPAAFPIQLESGNESLLTYRTPVVRFGMRKIGEGVEPRHQ